MAARKRTFGQVTCLPSGNYRARYLGPDGIRYTGPTTFGNPREAEDWLASERALLARDEWTPPPTRRRWTSEHMARRVTVAEYFEPWLAARTSRAGEPLAERTQDHYRWLMSDVIGPEVSGLVVEDVTPTDVSAWWGRTGSGAPTARRHAYVLLKSVMTTAVAEGLRSDNPCKVANATATRRVSTTEIATVDEAVLIAKTMPADLSAMVYLAAWGGLRFGELIELRRGDVDVDGRVVRVRRAVARTKSGAKVGKTKSEAGVRNVRIAAGLADILRDHLRDHVGAGATALLFPARGDDETRPLAPSTLYTHFYRAREAAGRDDLRFHDLRHTAATWAAQAGATLAELMAFLGQSTSVAALRYQHAARDRMAALADAMPLIP